MGGDIDAKHVATLCRNLNVSPEEEKRLQDERVSPILDTSGSKKM